MSKHTTNNLQRPADWVDPRNQARMADTSRVRHYFTPDGIEYWYDYGEMAIRTNDPDIYLSFHSFYAYQYRGHSYAILHFDGGFVTITQDWKRPDDVVFSPDYSERTPEGAQVWHVDHIFRKLVLPDCESYPWVEKAEALPVKTVSGFEKFRSIEQQDRFIHLITTLLSCYSGVPNKVLRGEVTKGHVVFGEELKKSFESGELIK